MTTEATDKEYVDSGDGENAIEVLSLDVIDHNGAFIRVLRELGFSDEELVASKCFQGIVEHPKHAGMLIRKLLRNGFDGPVFSGVSFETLDYNDCGYATFKERVTVRKGQLNLNALKRIYRTALLCNAAYDLQQEHEKMMRVKAAAIADAVSEQLPDGYASPGYWGSPGKTLRMDVRLGFYFPIDDLDAGLVAAVEWAKAVAAIPSPTAQWDEPESPDGA